QQRPTPPAPRTREALALVQPVRAMRPELDRVGDDPVAGPGGWSRNRAALVLLSDASPAREQRVAAAEDGALIRRARRDPARARPAGPVGVGLRRRHPMDAPLDADLPSDRRPVEG